VTLGGYTMGRQPVDSNQCRNGSFLGACVPVKPQRALQRRMRLYRNTGGGGDTQERSITALVRIHGLSSHCVTTKLTSAWRHVLERAFGRNRTGDLSLTRMLCLSYKEQARKSRTSVKVLGSHGRGKRSTQAPISDRHSVSWASAPIIR